MSIVTHGLSDHGTLVTQGYGVGRGLIKLFITHLFIIPFRKILFKVNG